MVTVSSLLQRTPFQSVDVLAGATGLERTISWAHVIEKKEIGHFLNGGELVLTTGMAIAQCERSFVSFVKQLIQQQVAALCVELSEELPEIPMTVQTLCNEHNFPLLICREEVRFIDMTQDLHTHLIQHHYENIQQLEQFTQLLNQLLLHPDPLAKILHHLQLATQKTFRIESSPTPMIASPSRFPIEVFEQPVAMLYLCDELALSEHELLFVERCVTALSYYYMRTSYGMERQKAQQHRWIHQWLQGHLQPYEIAAHLQTAYHPLCEERCAVLVTQQERPQDLTYVQMMITSLVEPFGFTLLPYVEDEQLLYVLLDQRDKDTCKKRLLASFTKVQKNEQLSPFSFYIGAICHSFSSLPKSYETAQLTKSLQKHLPISQDVFFYEDLHLHRLLAMIPQKQELHRYMLDYLQPIIEHDKLHQSQLLQTLTVYLQCQGNKKEAADRLFIVRQTLYHRLKQLQELLGEDFMEHGKRQAIEFALLVFSVEQPTPIGDVRYF
ncbi:PucR family transcription regulator [Fictibacillus macauensis ZFHKF-1]|uniref:PucR family transcription regulator n=1 Tax=Fictibacillus macauensis ZFHKF-1 TaxID=1196324 RepID=I8J4G1_9BACL|nr:PucR family transcriptional regulator [Fictibacillus macauensis]EIT86661.1 PucR family transcription regulator [Fictibacillus macauensis ZFHKF-1]